LSLLQNSNAISTGGDYNLESSLRLRESGSAYLSWTPASAGNRRTYTYSSWIKVSTKASNQGIFSANSGGAYIDGLLYISDGTIRWTFATNSTTYTGNLHTTQVLRDPSAWYHVVVAVDTTQATSSNRMKMYINGEQVTSFSTETYPALNDQSILNTTVSHAVGRREYHNEYFDGYITEVNFVDGQALTPSDFGETNSTTGVWKPKEYEGTYGTNGFYLPMKETQQATGFNTVLYTGNGGTQSISNVGFSPDLIWSKVRSSTGSNTLFDTIRGANYWLETNTTDAEENRANSLTSFDSDGFTLGSDARSNYSGRTYVAWCWDAGSSTVSNTDGSITSSVRANPATGFSVVTYTGNAVAGATVGHGLSSNPHVIIVKNRSAASDWLVYHHENTANPETDFLRLNTTATTTDNNTVWNDTAPTSSVFSIGTAGGVNTSSNNYVAYCFSEVSGYSKFGSYTGNGSVGNSVTGLGFEPAFLLIKNATDLGGSGESWYLYDNARDPVDTRYHKLNPNGSSAESTSTVNNLVDFDSDGFTIQSTNAGLNYNGDTYIYMAFADTRDAQFNFDASGNKNNWTPNNINSNASSETTYDIMNDVATLTDEDTANFATMNPLYIHVNGYALPTFSNGNLTVEAPASNVFRWARASIFPTSGAYYYEMYVDTYGSNSTAIQVNTGSTYTSYTGGNGDIIVNGSSVGTYSTWTTGDTLGVALDIDNGDVTYYKNGTQVYTTSSQTYDGEVKIGHFTDYGGKVTYNFGQRPFKYTPPTGYKKLNTYNLPDSTIVDGSQYMNTVLYTGNSSTNAITGVGFSPDFTWIKRRSGVNAHQLYDTVRGAGYVLKSNGNNAEAVETAFNSFDADGFEVDGGSGSHNLSGESYVAWNWRASDSSAVSNTDGTITSTVSANTTSGFSIVEYAGNGTSGSTIGHGLGAKPDVMIVKTTSTTDSWRVYHSSLGATKNLKLESTDGVQTVTNRWNNTEPTASVFTVGNDNATNRNGQDFIAYLFSGVEGFSKFGSFVGNGESIDGPFIYTGFRPAFVLFKRTGTASWILVDSSRTPYNGLITASSLSPNDTDAESTDTTNRGDLLSNGFRIASGSTSWNLSGSTYVYMAFAENPFKQSLAR